MDILKKTSIIMVSLIILTGCYTDFDPDEYSSPVICLNSVITAGEAVDVSVSHTWRYNDPGGLDDSEVNDARISVYANGMLQDSDYVAEEGEEIKIVAESLEYGYAEATVTVPKGAPIERVDFIPSAVRATRWIESEGTTSSIRFDFLVKLKITDVNSGQDYFRLGYKTYEPEYPYEPIPDDSDEEEESKNPYIYFSPGALDYDYEMIFKEHMGIVESVIGGSDNVQLYFTDGMFSGGSYTVNLKFEGAVLNMFTPSGFDGNLECGVTFGLFSLSRSYYDRLNYLWHKNYSIIGDLADLGLSDPIWGYSNVSSGAGVVAAKSMTLYDLDLKDFLIEALEGAEVIVKEENE